MAPEPLDNTREMELQKELYLAYEHADKIPPTIEEFDEDCTRSDLLREEPRREREDFPGFMPST